MFVFYSDSGEKKAAHTLLSHAFEEIYHSPAPAVAYDASGKPYFPSRPEVRFSLSHTRSHVMVALGDEALGCDAEDLRPVPECVVTKICSSEELAALDFFELWTLKESYLKLHGSLPGAFWLSRFTRGPSGAVISPEPDLTASLWRLEDCQFAAISRSKPPETMIFVPKNLLDPLQS